MIEKGVMSLWTAPAGNNSWYSLEHERKAWKLASTLLSKHFKTTELITDNKGWEFLKPLNLPFSSVRLDLNELDPKWANLWALGKIKAYSLQEEPFVHIDSDVFMFKKLSDRVLNAPFLAQMPEKFYLGGASNYKIDLLQKYIHPLPKSVLSALRGSVQYAANCGIYGGNDLSIIKEHTRLVFDLLNNSTGWEHLNNFEGLVILEQWLVGAVVREKRTFMEYVYPCATGPKGYYATSHNVGFTHFWGGEKRNLDQMYRLETWCNELLV